MVTNTMSFSLKEQSVCHKRRKNQDEEDVHDGDKCIRLLQRQTNANAQTQFAPIAVCSQKPWILIPEKQSPSTNQ